MTIPVQCPFLGPEELQAVGRVFESRWLGLGAIRRRRTRLPGPCEMLDARPFADEMSREHGIA